MTNPSPVNILPSDNQASRFPRARVRTPVTKPSYVGTSNTSVNSGTPAASANPVGVTKPGTSTKSYADRFADPA